MLKSKLALALTFALAGTNALAAIPKTKPGVPTSEALSLPLGNRLIVIREQGPDGYRNLVKIMEDTKQPMEMRWRAVTALGRIGGRESQPELEKALGSKEWYLRNAALVAMKNIDRETANGWARKLLNDKALMVRVAAVDTLALLRDSSASEVLWQKLYAPENFKGKQSLFIRRKIVEALALLEGRGGEARFVRVLEDHDSSLHPSAIGALERITQVKLGGKQDTTTMKRERWQAWWKEKTPAAL